MKHLLRFSIGFVAFAFLASAESSAQTLKTDIFPATPQAYALLGQYKEIVGTVESNTGSTITLRVKYDHPVVTGNVRPPTNTRTNNNSRNSRNRNPLAQIQALQRAQMQAMQQARANTKIDHDFIDFELPLSDKVTVRRIGGSGLEFDSNGFPKEASAGDKGMVGVAAKADELRAGTEVKVYFGGLSTATPAKRDSMGAVLSPAIPGGHPVIRMAVILQDAAMAAPGKKK